MRRMLIAHANFFLLFAGVLAIVALLFVQAATWPKMWVYPAVRQVARTSVVLKLEGYQRSESEHFIVRYRPEDADTGRLVLAAAEAAFAPVCTDLGFTPDHKVLIVIHPSRQDMRMAFGGSANESALGVYWAGVIEVLSPNVWLPAEDDKSRERIFRRNGPVTHEFTHFVVDHITNGNYPRWLTEGIAQYEEYTLNGYEWITRENSLHQQLYTMEAMEKNFDTLPNQSLTYRQSLAAVRYIVEVHGKEALRAILKKLRQGSTLPAAIKDCLGLSYPEFERAWQKWARTYMETKR